MVRRARSRVLLLATLAVLVPAVADDAPAADPRLAGVLARFDEVQDSVRTLTADLTMTTHNSLLKEPVVYRGRFFMTKPSSVRWEFDTPEEMRFVIANDEYVGYYPGRKKAERKNIQRWSERLFRYFGLGQGSKELAKFYRISLEDAAAEAGDTHVLILEPRKRRARKRVEQVRFEVDGKTMLPKRVEYHGSEGDVRIVEFEHTRLNLELSSSLYRMELPADVEVTTAFSPFGADSGS